MHPSDFNEIQEFKRLAPQWWNEKGPFRLLHEITPLRMKFLKERIETYFPLSPQSAFPLKGLRILDVGCGGGLLSEPLARLGADVIGIDPLPENIDVAKNHAKQSGLSIRYDPYGIEDLPQDTEKVDVVVASEIIEHVSDPNLFLKQCQEQLKTSGGIFLSTFNKTLSSYLLGIIAAEYILKWVPKGLHSWEKFISPEVLSRSLKHLGLGHQHIQGLRFSPLSWQWELSLSKDVNYLLWAAK